MARAPPRFEFFESVLISDTPDRGCQNVTGSGLGIIASKGRMGKQTPAPGHRTLPGFSEDLFNAGEQIFLRHIRDAAGRAALVGVGGEEHFLGGCGQAIVGHSLEHLEREFAAKVGFDSGKIVLRHAPRAESNPRHDAAA